MRSTTTLAPSGLADREFWLGGQDALRAAGVATADALGPLGTATGTARADLPAPIAHRLTEVTGGEPLLRLAVLTAASALAVRRLGASGPVLLVAEGTPVLIEVAPLSTFRELLGTARAAIATARAHGLPPASVVGATGSAISVRESGSTPSEHVGISWRLNGIEVSGRLPDTRAALLADGVAQVVARGLTDPNAIVARIGLLSPEAASLVVDGFNDVPGLPPAPPFRDQVLAHALARPDAVAVRDRDTAIDYARLCRTATAVAERLRVEGVGTDDVVAVVGARTAWFVTAGAGVLFAGAAYLPVDPAIPPERLRRVLGGVSAVIADDTVPLPPDLRRPVLRLDEIATAAVAGPLVPQGPPPPDRALAYLIFTSGSTGVPKGAALEHRSFLNLLAIRTRTCDLRPGVEFAQTVPLTTDVSVWQMFAGLTAGACVHVVDDDTVRTPEDLTALVVERGFEYLEVVPAQLDLLVEHLRERPDRADGLRTVLRGLICNGEVLGAELARRWHDLMPEVPLFNAYGPAECTDDATQGTVPADADGTAATIGRPLANIRVYVLDQDCVPAPPGVLGEIHIGGLSVGRGYHRAPGLTAAAFVPDPFSTVPGARMYRTGDLGRWRPDGELECLGRADGQVKVRGRRVELGEVEHVLESDPRVARAVVELLGDNGMARLVAVVTPLPGAVLPTDSVTARARLHLPDYMIPTEVLVRGRLPLSPNGKVDRHALRELFRQHLADIDSRRDQVPPRTPVERVLADLWARHLKLPSVGVHDDFFALGGDSIVNIRIVRAAAREGVVVRPKHIYDHRTIAELAEVAGADAEAAPAVPDGESAPLTPVQRWFFRQDFTEPHHWNQSYCLRATRPLDIRVLAEALTALTRVHEQLRVRFTTGTEVRQVVTPVTEVVPWRARQTAEPGRFDLVVDGSVVATGTDVELADRLHASLSLEDGRLLGALLFDDDPDRPRLLLTVHHLAVDRVSWLVLLEDLESAYLAIADGGEPSFPPRTAGFVHWARALAAESAPAAMPVACVEDAVGPPADERVPNLVADRRTTVAEWDPDTTSQISRQAALTTDEGLHAALVAALARAAAAVWGDGVLPLELEGHGRREADHLPGIGRTVGWFTVLGRLALPARRTGDPVAAVERAAELLVAARRAAGEPMADHEDGPRVAFNFMGRVDSSSGRPDELFTAADDLGWKCSPRGRRPLEWEINAGVVDGRLTVNVEHVPARQPVGAAEDFLLAFKKFLTDFTAGSRTGPPVADLVPLTPTQLAFFDREPGTPNRYNHAVLLTLREPVTRDRVEQAVTSLAERHPALRTRFTWTARGGRQGAARAEGALPVTEFDLRSAGEDLTGAVAGAADELHGALDLEAGPIGRVGLLLMPDGEPDRLLVVVHHAVVDPLSWDVLTPELSALLDGLPLEPPGPGYLEWARRLARHARTAAIDVDHWLDQDWSDRVALAEQELPGLERHGGTLFTEFDQDETDELVRSARLAKSTLFEYLLAELGRAAERWLEPADGRNLLVELGGHGREDLFDDLDVSTTVGWFTTAYPFLLPLPRGRDRAEHRAAVVEAIRAVPRRGFDFELARHLCPDPRVRSALAGVPQPSLRFDFDGELRFANTPAGGTAPMLSAGRTAGTGRWKPLDARRGHLLDAVAYLHDRRLTIRWQFSADVLDPARVAELVGLFMRSPR
ncbi:non-ribosomal peptide synthetase [Lentzea albida]|uniref:Amino acid adenylation domain-containing protein n=1 Tax=Lentzea albida TaxID=65499 RepID=A0A1H9C1B9_9PSEU|nr:non-ribosomal peptide synthetase [Lentzea albida]SEP95030.1 amino acid adenylation domain-containing protein [Lentzea albida]